MPANSPGWLFGYIPPASEWNLWWGKKQDWSPVLDAVTAAAPTANLYKISGQFTADGTIGTIPAGALITGVTFQETAGHTVSVALGTASGGAQILASTSVTASTILGLNALLLLAFLADQSVFIHSASWSSASITVTIWYER